MKVFAQSFTYLESPRTVVLCLLIGKESFNVTAEIKLVQLGKHEIQVVQYEEKFYRKIMFNGEISNKLGKIIMNIYNNIKIIFPIYLGDLIDNVH